MLPSGTYLPPPAEIKTSNWKAAATWDLGDTPALHPEKERKKEKKKGVFLFIKKKSHHNDTRKLENVFPLWSS